MRSTNIYIPFGFLPTPLGVEFLVGWQLRPGDMLSDDAASQDTVNGTVEFPEYPGGCCTKVE